MQRRQCLTAIGTATTLLVGGCVDEDAADDSEPAPNSDSGENAEESSDSGDQSEEMVQDPPNAQFSADSDESTDELSIIHVSGAVIDAEKVTIEGATVNEGWGTSRISAGDRVTVSTAGADSVRVVWTAESGSTAELFSVDVSE